MPGHLNRRQLVQYLGTMGILSALPASVLAEIISKAPPPSPFDDNSTAEEVTEGIDLSGKTFAITGCNSGLGFETMRVLTLRGAHVIGIARTQEKADTACASIDGETTPMFLDLADWESVVNCAEKIRGLNIPLDGLITNAGIMALPELQLVNGIERQFAINHLGHFILINQLQEPVLAAPQGRFVILSSLAHRRAKNGIDFDNLDGSKGYVPWDAYGQSKLANLLMSNELARRLEGSMTTSNAIHPGIIMTPLMRNLGDFRNSLTKLVSWPFSRNVQQGAATQCYVATSPALEGVSGQYFSDCNPATKSFHGRNPELARRLWDVSEELAADYL